MEYLLQLLIEKIENSENQWKPGANGWKSLSNKAGNLYDDRKHLKSDVVKAAKELEKTGLVKIEWVQGYREQDIQAIRYRQEDCLLYTSPSPRDKRQSRMPSSA